MANIANEMIVRARTLLATGNTKDTAAPKLSAEFSAVAYVSKGRLWASYKDEKGAQKTQVLA